MTRASPRIAVLGGTGRVGRRICARAAEAGISVLIIARNELRAAQLAADLNDQHPRARVDSAAADVHDRFAIERATATVDLLVVAAPVRDALGDIAEACSATACDCLDIVPAARIPDDLSNIAAVGARRGRLFVTQAGVVPGLPSALARAAARRVDACASVRVGIALGVPAASTPEDVYELIDAAADYQPFVFDAGRWTRVSRRRFRTSMDFGPAFGPRVAVPIDLPELHGIERELDLKFVAAYGASAAWRVDVAGRTIIEMLYRVRRGLGRRTAAALLLALARRSPATAAASIVATAEGRRGGRPHCHTERIDHADSAELTARVVTAFLGRYFAGAYRAHAGLRCLGHLLDDAALDDVRNPNGLGLDPAVSRSA